MSLLSVVFGFNSFQLCHETETGRVGMYWKK